MWTSYCESCGKTGDRLSRFQRGASSVAGSAEQTEDLGAVETSLLKRIARRRVPPYPAQGGADAGVERGAPDDPGAAVHDPDHHVARAEDEAVRRDEVRAEPGPAHRFRPSGFVTVMELLLSYGVETPITRYVVGKA